MHAALDVQGHREYSGHAIGQLKTQVEFGNGTAFVGISEGAPFAWRRFTLEKEHSISVVAEELIDGPTDYRFSRARARQGNDSLTRAESRALRGTSGQFGYSCIDAASRRRDWQVRRPSPRSNA